jgi:hypothetical protein
VLEKPRWLYRFVPNLSVYGNQATPDFSFQFTLNCFVGELLTIMLLLSLPMLTISPLFPFLSLDQRFVLSPVPHSLLAQ